MNCEVLKPDYVKAFKCIGSQCEYTCCKGWNVSVDEDTYRRYKKHAGIQNDDIRYKMNRHVKRNKKAKDKFEVAMIENIEGACVFLKKDGLCELHEQLGEGYLCYTCTMYPRKFKRVHGTMEQALTLSCPEVARLALLKKERMAFDQDAVYFDTPYIDAHSITFDNGDIMDEVFWDIRILIIDTLQNRTLGIEDRIFVVGQLLHRIHLLGEKREIHTIKQIIEEMREKVDKGVYKNILLNIPERMDLQIGIVRECIYAALRSMSEVTAYTKIVSKMIIALGLETEDSSEQQARYKEAYIHYYLPFMKKNEHILENYLVNYVFSEGVPLDRMSIWESYKRMILMYALVRTHLIAVASVNQRLDEALVIEVIYLVTRSYEHSKSRMKAIMRVLESCGFETFADMITMFKIGE